VSEDRLADVTKNNEIRYVSASDKIPFLELMEGYVL
jgi:hypothetical protein